MNIWDALICIILFGAVAMLVGHTFIDAIFKKKMDLINHMTEKGEV